MKFEIIDDSEHPIRLTLEGGEDEDKLDETDVIRAAYREAILLRAKKGNTGSISKFDRYIARSSEEADVDIVLALHSRDGVIEVLEQFHDRTDDAVAEIPEQSLIPPFENDFITLRFRLGEMALQLANDIRDAKPEEPLSDEDIDREVERFASDLNKHSPDQ